MHLCHHSFKGEHCDHYRNDNPMADLKIFLYDGLGNSKHLIKEQNIVSMLVKRIYLCDRFSSTLKYMWGY